MDNKTPQLEDGYTKIANEILEDLMKINIPCYQMRVLLCILRKTYGYHKKEDWLSVSQIVTSTCIYKAHVSRAKSELLKRHLVTSSGNKIAFQKNSKLWKELPHQVTVTSTGRKLPREVSPLPVQVDTKDNIQKIITKEIVQGIELFKEINPSYERLFSNITQRKSLERLIKKYGWEWVENLIKKLPEIISQPYAPRITTPYELETKLGQLKVFLQQEKLKANKVGSIKV